MQQDMALMQELAQVMAEAERHEGMRWHVRWKVEKFDGDWKGRPSEEWPEPAEVIEGEGNLLMYGGVSCLWQCLIGNGTGTAAQTLTYFNNGNAHIGVGDSNTAAAATQTDLQASTNKDRQPMESTYPQHTDATTSGAATITFRSVWGSLEGNFQWREWGIFNGSSGGRMLNRKVEDLGTKASGSTWTFTVTATIA